MAKVSHRPYGGPMTPSAAYEEFDAHLTRVAIDDADAVAEVVATVRRGDRTPADAIRALDAWFLRGQTMDAGVRAAGTAVPLVATLTGTSGTNPTAPDADGPRTSLRRTLVYLLALADLHGVDVDDTDRRKTLVTAVLLGDEGASLASGALAGPGGRWARGLASAAPVARLAGGNPLLATLVHRIVDGGVAVALASGGEAVRAQAVVTQASRAFGRPPEHFPGQQPRPRTPSEQLPNSAIYARALARTIHKARQRARGEGTP
mgnify:CR=1 FL=1